MSSVIYVIEITNPNQTIPINLAQGHLSNFSLIEYFGSGLINSNPLYLRFKNQPMNAIYGNLPATSLPLLWDNSPNSTMILNNPLPVCLGMNFTDCHQLQISVEDINQQQAQFTRLVLIFRADLDSATQKWHMTNLEKSLRQA
jgi:hypothetical protein